MGALLACLLLAPSAVRAEEASAPPSPASTQEVPPDQSPRPAEAAPPVEAVPAAEATPAAEEVLKLSVLAKTVMNDISTKDQ